IQEPVVTLLNESTSEKTATPWLDSIIIPPVITLSVKPTKDNNKVNWVFLIKDSHGQNFFEMKKNGILPEKILWDGYGKNGRPLQVGSDYSYSLSIIDKAGNPQRYAGQPFKITAFQFVKAGTTRTHFYPESLFLSESSAKLSKEGKSS